MKTYKNIECLKNRLMRNTGSPVKCWSDEGIKVNGRKYFLFEYGNMGHGFDGNCYVTFRNVGRSGRNNGINEPLDGNDSFITIEYLLHYNEAEKTNNIFEFLLLRENW